MVLLVSIEAFLLRFHGLSLRNADN